jgi:hypothetical protein
MPQLDRKARLLFAYLAAAYFVKATSPGGFEFWSDPDVSRGTAGLQTLRWREMDSNFQFRDK